MHMQPLTIEMMRDALSSRVTGFRLKDMTDEQLAEANLHYDFSMDSLELRALYHNFEDTCGALHFGEAYGDLISGNMTIAEYIKRFNSKSYV